MPIARIREFLDGSNVPYTTIQHSKAYTAQGIAALTHIPGRELAKTVILRVNDELAMAVLPSSRWVDLAALRKELCTLKVELASEFEFDSRFPDCETGAMPPLGNLYHMPVLVDASLAEDKEIAFNAGSHYEVIRMKYADFARLVNPRVLQFAAGHMSAH